MANASIEKKVFHCILLKFYLVDVSPAVALPLDEVHSNSLNGATETTDISGK